MKLELTQELVQAIVNYLGTKPFVEVAPLIQRVQEETRKKETEKEGSKK